MIIALDIAANTGVAVGWINEKPRCWSVDVGRKRSLDDRLGSLFDLTDRLIQEHAPVQIVAEDKLGGKKVNATLIQMCGAVRACAAVHRVPFSFHHVASVRRHFIGKNLTKRDFPGLSEKDARKAIKDTVIARCAVLGWGDLDEDASDAAALLDYALAKHRAHQSVPVGGLFHA